MRQIHLMQLLLKCTYVYKIAQIVQSNVLIGKGFWNTQVVFNLYTLVALLPPQDLIHIRAGVHACVEHTWLVHIAFLPHQWQCFCSIYSTMHPLF